VTGGAMFDRGELLAGMSARRATTLLFAIEARTAHLVARSRRALATFETERTAAEREQAFLQALAAARESGARVRIQDLERYASSWGELVPDGADLRAAVLKRIADKYGLPAGRVPRILAALGAEDPGVQASYARQFGAPLSAAYAPTMRLRDRLSWARATASERLEALPPFWMAFAITATETIAEGILAVPIAVAGIGVIPGILLLVVLGLVNVLTIGAIVESIVRTGRMRYGETYLGSLVAEYLGRGGNVLFGLVLFVGGIAELLAYSLGFAAQLADTTGIPQPVWILLLFAANVAVLWRGDLDATVATALVLGAVNLVLIAGICAFGLMHLDASRLVAPGHGVLGPGPLALAFGVVLLAYFGHASTANTAKVVLRADPSGRSLLAGSAAAMAVVAAVLIVGVVAINGAVPAEALASAPGTAVGPLAEVAGPIVGLFGSLYTALAIGLGSVYCSLQLYNQVREQLPSAPAPGSAPSGVLGRLLLHPRSRWAIAMAPMIATFAAIEAIVLLGLGTFVEALGVVGTLEVPLLAGVFPMLLLGAARRRGEFVPRPALRLVGNPLVIAIVSVLFMAVLPIYGAVIWDDPLRRALALVVGIATVVVAAMAVAGRAFRPRSVVELRVEGRNVRTLSVSLVVDGRAVPAAATWTARRAGGAISGFEGRPPRADEVGGVEVPLPQGSPSEVRIWSHEVRVDGESSPWPAAASVVTPSDGAHAVALDRDGIGDDASVASGALVSLAALGR
jgi:amino acid permease